MSYKLKQVSLPNLSLTNKNEVETSSKIIGVKNMFDNWIKSWEDLYTYKYWKKEVIKWHKKTLEFWKDAFEDLQSFNKKNKD